MPVDLGGLVRRGIVFVLLLIGLSVPALAQKGTIAGLVVDAETGETLVGANVVLAGTTTGSTTDLDGRYVIQAVEPGTYDLVFSYIGFNGKTVRGVVVQGGQTTRIDIDLTPETFGLDEVVVEARAVRDTEASLLRERQKAAGISDAISAEAISRSGAGDASAAMTKVTGASVVGGKYVYIRGLGERYSSTQLNGTELPSADPDKKAFQLDLFPASLLEQIVTLKTFTPDKPGSFSGGLVNVGTKRFPEQLTAQISFSSSYNTQTTFADDVLGYDGGEVNWLGFREMPAGLPDLLQDPAFDVPRSPTIEIEARRDPEKAARLDALARAFDPVMYPTTRSAPVDQSLSAALGNQVMLAGRPLGFTLSLHYGQQYSSYADGQVGRYELVGGAVSDVTALTPLRLFGGDRGVDVKGAHEAELGALGTLAFRPHADHEISGTYLRTRNATTEARFLTGFWQDLSSASTFQTRVLAYKERDLQSMQLRGTHLLAGLTVEWNASQARNTQQEPDLRYFSNHYTLRERDGRVDTLYSSPASLYPAPTRIFRDLSEDNRSAGLDVSVPFRQWSGLASKLKVGVSYLDVARAFEERRFEYREGQAVAYSGFQGDDAAYFRSVGVADTTASGRFRMANYIIETSPLKNNYDGAQSVAAGYAMIELGLTRRLRFIGGARFETTDMETVSADTSQPVGRLDNEDWLPSINLAYSLRDDMNLRAAYTRTLARPTFRELAPYSTFDFVGDFVFAGNAGLKRTAITNYDLRWEWFVRPGEVVAASAFYKRFENPIERVILTRMGASAVSVQNVDRARVYGVELEARKRLDGLGGFMRHFQVGGNFTLVQSRVDIPADELVIIQAADPGASTTRSLQGQSPYLLNVNLAYEHPDAGTSVGLQYNVFGDRLATVTEGAAPDVFERARRTLDFVATQRVMGHFRVKVSAKNLLNDPVRFSQAYRGQEYDYYRYTTGRVVSLGISYAVD